MPLARATDGALALTGGVSPSQEPALRAVQRWSRGTFGARALLIDGVGVADEAPPWSVRAAWTSPDPYVTEGAGERPLLGAHPFGGWVITGIAGDRITLRRGGRSLEVHFRPQAEAC